MHMKYLPILIFAACIACQSQNTRPPASPGQDTVLYSDWVRPVTDSIAQFPQKAELYYRRALLLFNTHPALAQADFEKAAGLATTVTDYWAGAGEAALVQQDYKQAAIFFDKALHTAPGYTYLQYRLAMALVESGQTGRADSLAGVLAQSPDARDKAFYLKARMAEDKKDTTAAIQYLRNAIASTPQPEYEAVMEAGDLLQQRSPTAAITYYELAFRIDSSDATPLLAIGQLQEKRGQETAAIQAYRRCIITDPGYTAAYMGLGRIFAAKKDWKTALSWYNLAAKASPADAEAYYNRGRCQEQLGNRTSARDDYARAVSLKKDYKEAMEAWERLK